MSTHIFFTVDKMAYPERRYIFVSDYGFGSIQMYASNENYYNGDGDTYTNTYSGKYTDNMVSIYDGIINDISICANGFYSFISFSNLLCKFNNYLIVTSCCISWITDTTLNTYGYIINNCHYGMFLDLGSSIFCDNDKRNIISNMYYDGITFNNSKYYGARVVLTENHTNGFYCRYPIRMVSGSSYSCAGTNMQYNNVGLHLSSGSDGLFFMNYDPNTPISTIHHNNTGILVENGSFFRIDYLNTSYNNTGIYCSYRSTIRVDSTSNIAANSFISDNCTYGITCVHYSTVLLNDCSFSNNTSYDIYNSNSSLSINNCSFNSNNGISIEYNGYIICNDSTFRCNNKSINFDKNSKGYMAYLDIQNSYYGIWSTKSNVHIVDCNIINNTYGIVGVYQSNIFIYMNNSNYRINNNSSDDLNAQHDSHFECNTNNEITNTNITYNQAPTYTKTYLQGAYILQYGY
jgi:hypothetical protein